MGANITIACKDLREVKKKLKEEAIRAYPMLIDGDAVAYNKSLRKAVFFRLKYLKVKPYVKVLYTKKGKVPKIALAVSAAYSKQPKSNWVLIARFA